MHFISIDFRFLMQLSIHIYPSTFLNESRILKIVNSLGQHTVFDRVKVIAVWKDGLKRREILSNNIELIRVPPLFGGDVVGRVGQLLKALGWYINVILVLRRESIASFSCHSLPVLPLSVLIKVWKRCILVYEPHELETETAGLHGVRQWLARKLESVFIRAADAICVVNHSIADWYKSVYGLQQVWVVRNIPTRVDSSQVRTGLLRSATGIAADSQIFLYQGLLARGRGIGLLLEIFSSMPKEKHLVFMGYGEFEGKIKDAAKKRSNIHFLQAVAPEKVQDYTVDADVGLSLIEDVCLSYYLSLPNKLFEYVMCGVPILASDFPEIGGVIDRWDCGWKMNLKSELLLDLMQNMSMADIAEKRANARIAGQHYGWKEEEKNLFTMYSALGFYPKDVHTTN